MKEFKIENEYNQEFETTVSEQEVIVSLLFSEVTEEWFLELKKINSDGDTVGIQGYTKVTSKLPLIINDSFEGNFVVVPKNDKIRGNPNKLNSFEDDYFFLYLTKEDVIQFGNNKKV